MPTPDLETLSERRCFGGVQGFYRHDSAATGGPMRIGVFVPDGADAVGAAGALLTSPD